MKMITVLTMLLVLPSAGRTPAEDLQILIDVDREVSGLLDAYLEAVPECPARSDTPLRLWVLDLAWIRAGSAIDSMMTLQPPMLLPDSQLSSWTDFISGTEELFRVYDEIQSAYHAPSLPDSSLCVMLEDRLLRADSVWRHSEMVLFELMSEEGTQ
ncbi:MAG: hypothetical protein JXR55_04720 [Candidatus Fermentibacteraceae bacterium]|nr:hypothetical protein [Candidatus Fermentibacteraceae bacterium]